MKKSNHMGQTGYHRKVRTKENFVIFFAAITIVGVSSWVVFSKMNKRNNGIVFITESRGIGSLNEINTPASMKVDASSSNENIGKGEVITSDENFKLTTNDEKSGRIPSSKSTENSLSNESSNMSTFIRSKLKENEDNSGGATAGGGGGGGVIYASSGKKASGNQSGADYSSIGSLSNLPSDNSNSKAQMVNPYQPNKGGTDPGGDPDVSKRIPVHNGTIFLILLALVYSRFKLTKIQKKLD